MASKFFIVAVAALAVSVTGCARGERVEKRVAARVNSALDELKATAPQRARVTELEQQLVNDAKPVIEQGVATRASLVEQWKATTPDAALVHRLIDAQIDSIRGLANKVADAALEVHGLLTPEQRDQVSARIAERQAQHPRSR